MHKNILKNFCSSACQHTCPNSINFLKEQNKTEALEQPFLSVPFVQLDKVQFSSGYCTISTQINSHNHEISSNRTANVAVASSDPYNTF